MRMNFAGISAWAARHNIEIGTAHKSDGERYQVIQCGVPGATEYGCRNLVEVIEAINEIIAVPA